MSWRPSRRFRSWTGRPLRRLVIGWPVKKLIPIFQCWSVCACPARFEPATNHQVGPLVCCQFFCFIRINEKEGSRRNPSDPFIALSEVRLDSLLKLIPLHPVKLHLVQPYQSYPCTARFVPVNHVQITVIIPGLPRLSRVDVWRDSTAEKQRQRQDQQGNFHRHEKNSVR